MSASRHILFGTIILADVDEPNGAPAGPHPAVVLSSQADIDAGVNLQVAVCSTAFRYPLRDGWFDMPTHPEGHAITGLTEACVVKATWTAEIPQANVLKLYKRCPIKIVKMVIAWLRANGGA